MACVIGDSSRRVGRKKEKDTAAENGSRPAFHVFRHFHNVRSTVLVYFSFFVNILINELLDL